MTVRSIVCVFFKCYDNYRHVTVFYCHGIIRIKQELLQEVIMKKRIVQLQIGAAAIAAILGTGSVINAFPCSAALVTAYAKEQNTEENVTVVNEKTTWKYLDNNTDPASGCPRSLLGLLLILMTLHGSLPPENSVRKGALLHLLTDLLRQFFYSNIKIKKTANVLRHFSSVQLLMHKILIRSLLSQELFSMTTLLPFT